MSERSDGTWRILLVTPNNPVRLWAASYLRNSGYVVVDVRSAAEALYLAGRYPFNLTFAEVRIPSSREGFNLAWHINRCRPAATVFLCPDADCLIEQVRCWVDVKEMRDDAGCARQDDTNGRV
jgi:CheY-like chemotaxis protein